MSDQSSSADSVLVPFPELLASCERFLLNLGLSPEHAGAMSRVIAAAERDDCTSHGVFRLMTCAETVRAGKVRTGVRPQLQDEGGPVIRVDAGFGFSPLAFETGLAPLVSAAGRHGLAALVINHCFHFSALWPEIEAITRHGLAALAISTGQTSVAPAGGRSPLFGTNPIAFGWPRGAGEPYVFDFATSAITRGDLELHRRAGKQLPDAVGIDAQGRPSTDAQAVVEGAILPFGGHKGSALSTMIELMAGPLIGDLTSREWQARNGGTQLSTAPCHGELVMAFDPGFLSGGGAEENQRRAEGLFEAIVSQGARLPSQRRFAARARSLEVGVGLPRKVYEELFGSAS